MSVVTKLRMQRGLESLPKFVSMRRRYVWMWIPKNGGGSVFRSLMDDHGAGGVALDLSLDEICTLNPEIRTFTRYAFVRNPWTRAASCWLNKVLVDTPRNRAFVEAYSGLRIGMGFDEFAAWLCSPNGADDGANLHWKSQHLMLAEITDLLRFEDLENEVKKLGLSGLKKHTNSSRYWMAQAGMDHTTSYADLYRDRGTADLIGQRYAEDIERFGYSYPF